MKILIDLQGAQAPGSRNRGIGRYTVALTQAMVRQCKHHRIHLLLNGAFPDAVDELRKTFEVILPQGRIHVWNPLTPAAQIEPGNSARRRTSEDMRELVIRQLNPDVVHISSLFEGMHDDAVCSIGQLYTDIPTSVTLFDLIPLIYSEVYLQSPIVAAWYAERLDHLRRADALLAISESARLEAIEHLGFDEERALNVGTAADPQFQRIAIDPQEEMTIRKAYGLSKPFVMYTGGIDSRKNVEALIRAYASLPKRLRREHQLALVCTAQDSDRSRLQDLAREAGLDPNELVMTGFVPEDHLIALYNLTTLFVFPSWHEGFGLPALEAMHCGAPVIASNRSSLPEVVGLQEALFDPFDESEIAAFLIRGLKDKPYRSMLKANGEKQAQAFSWDDSGRRAIATFERLHESAERRLPNIPNYRPRDRVRN